MTRQHSDFPASSAKRLLACPASYAETKALANPQVRKTSSFAAEGTLAHQLSEDYLRGHIVDLHASIGQKVDVDGFQIEITDEMVDGVLVYAGVVQGLEAVGYEITLEQRVSPDWLWRPGRPPIELFGTSDCIAYHPTSHVLVIADLKYGRGVYVDAEWNPQLLYYALGALREIESRGQRVDMIDTLIVQPRAPHGGTSVRHWRYSRGQLVGWGEDVLKPGVDLVTNHRATLPFAAGDHCKFCPALANCPELRKTANAAAKALFAGTPVSPTHEETMSIITALEPWIDAAKQAVHQALEDGVPVDGWKLVSKRATRKWTDETTVANTLAEAGVPAKDYMEPPAVRSVAQVLKSKALINDDRAMRTVQQMITINSSGTTMAPADDPRPAVTARPSAKDVFMNNTVDPLEP